MKKRDQESGEWFLAFVAVALFTSIMYPFEVGAADWVRIPGQQYQWQKQRDGNRLMVAYDGKSIVHTYAEPCRDGKQGVAWYSWSEGVTSIEGGDCILTRDMRERALAIERKGVELPAALHAALSRPNENDAVKAAKLEKQQ